MLLILAGRAGVGKDTVANYLQRNHSFTPFSIATPLKDACATVFNVPRTLFDSELKDKKYVFKDKTCRDLMQEFGALVRQNQGALHWVNLCLSRIDAYIGDKKTTNIVITDVRFEEEKECIERFCKEKGIDSHFIQIKGSAHRQLSMRARMDLSEQQLFLRNPSHVLYNDRDLSHLYAQVETVFDTISSS
jgi:guanylate kinase